MPSNYIIRVTLKLCFKIVDKSLLFRSLPLMCIAPLGKDALECLRYTDNVEKSVRNVINTSWPPGSQNEEYFDSHLMINHI